MVDQPGRPSQPVRPSGPDQQVRQKQDEERVRAEEQRQRAQAVRADAVKTAEVEEEKPRRARRLNTLEKAQEARQEYLRQVSKAHVMDTIAKEEARAEGHYAGEI